MKVGIFLFNKRIVKYSLYFLIALTAILGTIFIARSAYATIAINDTVKNNAVSYTSYVSLSGCARYKLKSSIQTDASNPKSTDPSSWYGPDINGGNSYVYPSGKNTECGDIMKNVSSLWGISDYGKFLRDVGYTFDESVPEYKWNGSDDERRDAFSKQIASKTVNGIRADTLTDATKYAIYASSLDGDCKGTDVGPYTSTYKSYADSGRRDGDYIFAKVVTSGGDRVYKRLYSGEMTVYGYVASNFQTGSSVRSVKCGTINDTVNATAAAYLKEEAKGLCQTSGPKYTEAKLINACANGAANKGSGLMFCVNSYKGYYSGGSGSNQKDERDACFVGQGNGGGGQCVDIGYNTDTTLQACINGIKNSSNTSYCNSTYPAPDNLNSSGSLPNDTNAEKRKACTDGQGLKVTANPIDTPVTNPSSEDPNLTSSCVVEGIGWIICPVTKFLADISDSSFSVISNFLMVNVKLLDTNSGTYTAWSTFRSIANVAFVIVFLIIIFSQLTGQGVSNYGIKKTLPRLIVAAILVNISFYVCQLAVDLTQIVGVGIKQLLENIPVGSAATEGPGSWTDVMGDILMGTTVLVGVIGATAAAVAIAGLSISLPVLLAVLLAVLMTVIILMARQAGIVILIILSPLAFVAYLLPNTEQWFKRWYKVFLALLMVFPTVALLYGGGALTSKILSNVANSPGVDASSKFWISLTALAVASLPLIMTPSLLRGALNGIGSMGAKISGLAAKANGRIRSTANSSSRYGEAKQGIKNRFALARAQKRVNSKTQQAIDRSPVGRALGLDRGASRALATVKREEAEETKLAQVSLEDEMAEWKASGLNPDDMLSKRALDKNRSAGERRAAMHQLASLGRDKAIRSLRQDPRFTKEDEVSLQSAISTNAGSLLGKAPDLVKGQEASFNDVSGDQLSSFSEDTARAHAQYLSDLYTKASAPTATQLDRDSFNKAYSAYSSAVTDIHSNPTLQAKFSGDAGKKYIQGFTSSTAPSGFAAYRPSYIQNDGKIR
jgi:hypothetical protein